MSPYQIRPGNPYYRTALSALILLLLTSVHHAYGAAVYDTPWRMQIVFIAALAAMLIAGLLYVGWRRGEETLGRAATWLAIVVTVAFPIGMIGMFEGGYNHVLKNIIYYSDVGIVRFRELFPAPAYEMPGNAVFELTGIAQFFVALWVAVEVARLILMIAPARRRQSRVR